MKNNYILSRKTIQFFFILSFFVGMIVKAQPQIVLTPVITTGLNAPMQFVNAADGTNRVFIVQKGGTILAYDASFNLLSTFLTVTNITSSGERGLLSMAFHPDYENNGLFYVYYTNAQGDLELARYKVSSSDADMADASSKVVLITIPHPTNANHNGGELHFGTDGNLYLSTGDGGGAGDVPNNAQNTSVLLGKILRFNVNTSSTAPYYTIPTSNPYNNEIYALGLRNPYRWSFDRQTQDMWIGDVGQDSFEEINFRAAANTLGANYGWRCYEGTSTFNTGGCGPASSYVSPAHFYPTQDPSASITGGIVYRGTAQPTLQGYYLSADFYSGIWYILSPDGNGGFATTTQTLSPTGMVDFGETENGEAYVVSNTGNRVFRIDQQVATSIKTINASAAESYIYPTLVNDHTLHLGLTRQYESFEIKGLDGKTVFSESLNGLSGEISVNFRDLAPGIYFATLNEASGNGLVKKIIVSSEGH